MLIISKTPFDRVNHRLLLAKLARIGLSTPLVNWFRSYISERSYYVQIDGVSSNVFESSSGVPQGSNLGPLLFSLFINDVTLAITEADCLLYADDVRLFRIIRNTSDSLSLQRSIDVFSDWCINNDLLISVDKCTSMSFFRIASPIRYIYSISGTQLPRYNTVRDLGVTLGRKLDFRQHYCDILDKACCDIATLLSNIVHFRLSEYMEYAFYLSPLVARAIAYRIIMHFAARLSLWPDLLHSHITRRPLPVFGECP